MKTDYPQKRFWKYVDKGATNDDCWVWTGGHQGAYGIMAGYWWKRPDGVWRTRQVFAHRLAYEWFIGPLDGVMVGWTCENKKCVNPYHLVNRRVTPRATCRRGHPKSPGKPCLKCANENQRALYVPHPETRQPKKICKWGHPLTPGVVCKECMKRRNAKYYSARKARKAIS